MNRVSRRLRLHRVREERGRIHDPAPTVARGELRTATLLSELQRCNRSEARQVLGVGSDLAEEGQGRTAKGVRRGPRRWKGYPVYRVD